MAQTSQVEIERKYDVDDGALTPAFTSVPGIARVIAEAAVSLEAVYYDTADLDLLVRRIILRRRAGGSDAGWHIKLPAAEGRTELHWPLDAGSPAENGSAAENAGGAVPDAVLDPVRVVVRDRILTPLARISTRRAAAHLIDGAGVPVAEFADDIVTASDVRGGGVRAWREWEVELLPGAPETEAAREALLDAIEQVVLAEAAHPSASPAKIARALGHDSLPEALDARGQTRARGPGQAPPRAGAAAVIVAALAELVAALERADPAARDDRPDAVHQMRTIVRRLRSLLAAYRRLFDRERVEWLRGQLQLLGQVLGRARDAEVRAQRAADELERLSAHRVDEDARRRLVEGARDEHRQAHAAALRQLSSSQYYRLFDALDEFVAHPPLTGKADAPIGKVVRKVLAKEVARVRTSARRASAAVESPRPAAEPAGPGSTAAVRDGLLHETRKAARRLRYAAEAAGAGAALADTYRTITHEAERVQDALGEHRDSAQFVEHLLLTSSRAHAAGEDTFVYGALSGSTERSGESALAAASSALRRLEKSAKRL